jgi:hypothetical protein
VGGFYQLFSHEVHEVFNLEGVEISIKRTKVNPKMPFRLKESVEPAQIQHHIDQYLAFSALNSGTIDFSPLAKRLKLTVF